MNFCSVVESGKGICPRGCHSGRCQGASLRAKANVWTPNIYCDARLPFSRPYTQVGYNVFQLSAIELFWSPLPDRGTLPQNATSVPSLTVFRKRLKITLQLFV